MDNSKEINPRRPIPKSGYDRLRDNLNANFRQDFPSIENSFPGPDIRPSTVRGNQISRKDDKIKIFGPDLKEHDEAIMYYFNNVIKPQVIVNGNRTNVPIIYGSPERWKGVQKDGFYRDKEGKIQVPLIMFKRDSVEKRRDLGNKLDANNAGLHYTFQKQFTKRNVYDNFSVLQGRKPQREMYKVVVPDFIKLQYTCTIWTDYIAQMNKLVEMINYTSDSYWGDKERFQFNAKIDTYNNTTEVAQGENRTVKTTFGLTLQGYLVPDSLNKLLATAGHKKHYTRSKIVFNTELVTTSTSTPQTREEIRSTKLLGENIQVQGVGVGYTIIGNNNVIG